MAKLTGLQIQKLLPKTNCKECGSSTCMAFAMKLASQKASLSECPYASDEAIKILGAASGPPVKAIILGKEKNVKLGEETVLYRHEKTFINQTAIAVNINDTDKTEFIMETVNNIKEYVLERVGEELTIDLVSLTNCIENNSEEYSLLAKKIYDLSQMPLILKSPNLETLKKAAQVIKGSNSVICPDNNIDIEEIALIANTNGHSLVITGENPDEIVKINSKLNETGFNNLILQFNTFSLSEDFQSNSIARISAIKNNFKELGYPTIKYIKKNNVMDETVSAVTQISKYGGIIVLPTFDPAQLVSLMTLRLNIYTDPQKPIQVEPRLYTIGEPDENSPVFVTTNFSLTYFIVSGEIENSGTSAYLVVPECEGMSVLTAWAAGKFSGSHIGKFIKEIGLENQIKTREIIIPGYIAQISGELEEALPEWKVKVGPQEASDIESYVKAMQS